MNNIPTYLFFLGGLRKDSSFARINSRLVKIPEGTPNLYRILTFRFWCHAHVYSPVLSLIFLALTGRQEVELVLLLIAVGSLSFGIFEAYGGSYADKHGCKSAINFGLKLMILTLILFGVAITFSQTLGGISVSLAFIGQILIGLPLALINGADTELTKKITRNISSLSEEEGDLIEGLCTKFKYVGIALASFFGCLIFIVFVEFFESYSRIGQGLIFWLTIISQIISLYFLSLIQEPKDNAGKREDSSVQNTTLTSNFIIAFKAILADKIIISWLTIIGIIEGLLLFSKYYKQ